jgi:hypothetical protein
VSDSLELAIVWPACADVNKHKSHSAHTSAFFGFLAFNIAPPGLDNYCEQILASENVGIRKN